MLPVAPDVFLLSTWFGQTINAYLIGDVLVDAGIRSSSTRLAQQLRGRSLRAHALTHAHSDHQGASAALCLTLNLPLWASPAEADVMAQPYHPRSLVDHLQARFWRGPAYPVVRRLREGDEVGGFEVLELPGHSPGHLGFWRQRDRVLLAGDVLMNLDLRTGRERLGEPLRAFTADQAGNRQSIQRIAALAPALTLFGHGPPLYGPAKLEALAQKLT